MRAKRTSSCSFFIRISQNGLFDLHSIAMSGLDSLNQTGVSDQVPGHFRGHPFGFAVFKVLFDQDSQKGKRSTKAMQFGSQLEHQRHSNKRFVFHQTLNGQAV